MKTNVSDKQHPTHPQKTEIKRPENKNNLDSREGEEQLDKGDDVTHNSKTHHNNAKSNNKNNY